MFYQQAMILHIPNKILVFLTLLAISCDSRSLVDVSDGSLLWTAEAFEEIASQYLGWSETRVAATADRAFYHDDESIVAHDLRTGKKRWERQIPVFAPYFIALHAQDEVLYGGYTDSIFAIDPRDGDVRWISHPDYITSTRLIIDDRRIYVPGRFGRVSAVDRGSGSIVWRNEITEGATAHLFLAQKGALLCIAINGFRRGAEFDPSTSGLSCLSAADGRVLWTFRDIDLLGMGYPVILGDLVVVGSASGMVYAVEAESGRLSWKRHIAGTHSRVNDVHDLLIACVQQGPPRSEGVEGSCAGMRPTDGEILWSRSFAHLQHFSPAIAGGRVFIRDGGDLVELHAATGRVIRVLSPLAGEAFWGPPVAAGGVLLVPSNRRLYAFDDVL